MRQFLTRSALALMVFIAPLASAEDLIKPGLWEETIVVDTLGDGKKGDKSTKCWTPAKVAEMSSREAMQASLLKQMAKGCALAKYERNAKGLNYEVSCPGGAGMSGKLVLSSSTSMNARATMSLGGGKSGTQEKNSRWVSANCEQDESSE